MVSTRRLGRPALALAAALVAIAATAALPGSADARAVRTAPAARSAAAAPAARPRTPDHFTPHNGVTYNNPLGSRASKRRNMNLLLRSINSSPAGSTIRIATWNFRSHGAVRALEAAAVRGVSVHVSISSGNDIAHSDTANPGYDRFRRYLRKITKRRHLRPSRSDWARDCYSACRSHIGSHAGISHTKFYLFSQVGRARNVAIYGSANLTDLASGFQWNDLYTDTNPQLYAFMINVFRDMQPEHSQRAPFRSGIFGSLQMQIFPDYGPGSTPNPALTELDKVSCADPGSVGINHHTEIRIAQTALLDVPGTQIATKLSRLRAQGCDIKLMYAEIGPDVRRILRAGHVPSHQLIQDFNDDGVFDRYIHTKVMTISGNYDGVPNTQIAFNGSHNWTQVSLDSDETFAGIRLPSVVRSYNRFTDYWFAHGPNAAGGGSGPVAGRRASTSSPKSAHPYAKVQLN